VAVTGILRAIFPLSLPAVYRLPGIPAPGMAAGLIIHLIRNELKESVQPEIIG
jgi:hypothetical protein